MPSACQVVPDIPSFAVDDGFTYLVPEGMTVSVGSKVRVRVSGRRLSGYVTAVMDPPSGRKLLPIDGVSGDIPLFGRRMLDVCRWAATHYVAPLSVLLKRSGPPNVARRRGSVRNDIQRDHRGTDSSITYAISASPHTDAIRSAVQAAILKGAVGVLVATASEVVTVSDHLKEAFGTRVVAATSSMSGKEVTATWVAGATTPKSIVVGTREIALWPLHDEGDWILVEDGRRMMKSPSTPTTHVREILMERTRRSGSTLRVIGPVPTLEILEAGAVVSRPSGRWWPNVEIIDRTLEPPTASLFTEHVKRAIASASADHKTTFVLVTARGYAPAFRCIACMTLRICTVCGTTASSEERCRRCSTPLRPCVSCSSVRFEPLGAGIGRVIDDISRFVAPQNVGEVGSGSRVLVGSERDLVGLGIVDLGVVVDIDGMSGAPHYRASEDALRLAVRLANRATGGGGRRLLVQTSNVGQRVVVALAAGNADEFIAEESEIRRRAGFPPFGELIAIETSGIHDADATLRSAIGKSATVRGPAEMRDRSRWLLSGDSLAEARIALRTAVDLLRSKGAKVRVDADPIDL